MYGALSKKCTLIRAWMMCYHFASNKYNQKCLTFVNNNMQFIIFFHSIAGGQFQKDRIVFRIQVVWLNVLCTRNSGKFIDPIEKINDFDEIYKFRVSLQLIRREKERRVLHISIVSVCFWGNCMFPPTWFTFVVSTDVISHFAWPQWTPNKTEQKTPTFDWFECNWRDGKY